MSDKSPAPVAENTRVIRLWDLPLRLFHWCLAACVVIAWALGKFGPDIMTLHFIVGYAVAGLLVFRIIWGLVGPRHARFASLLHGPRTLFAYLREVPERRPSYWPGHNPLGGLFVILLLAVLVVQVVTGLIADPEDFVNVGPLADRVTTATSRAALNLHDILGSLLLPLVVLHVAVVFFYKAWKRENLIRPMITGFKRVRE